MAMQNQKGGKDDPKPGYRYPDGGWGWIIVFATGLSSFITFPVMQSFALLFDERIEDLNMSSADLTTIIDVNAAFGMSLGLITGHLLKKFGYRKIALFGAFSSFIGITCTSWANSFLTFLIAYSIVTSMGTFMLMSSFSLAINTYFRERRGYASGMSTAFTGLGPVVMPQVITMLLRNYNTQGTTMILGALSAHSILAALLLQPVKWHMVKVEVEEEEKEIMNKEGKASELTDEGPRRRKRTITSNSVDLENDIDSYSYGGCETPLVSHRRFGSSQQINGKRKYSINSFQRSISQNDDGPELSKRVSKISKDHPWWKSEDTINLGSSVKIFDEKIYHPMKQLDEKSNADEIDKKLHIKDEVLDIEKDTLDDHKNNNDGSSKIIEEKSICQRICDGIVSFFDLTLLTDSGYVILMLGMSLAICAELNFSLFTPLILKDYGFSKQETATFMSVVGFTDIVFRFSAPFIGDCLKFSAQNMYLMSLIMLITTRTSLMLFHDYTSAIIVACALGVAKGIRTVYMGLVIPSYVPLHRLASASGIQSAVNCVFIIMSIPLMAAVHDSTGSYNWCIAALNSITFVTVSIWTIQNIYLKYQKHETNDQKEQD